MLALALNFNSNAVAIRHFHKYNACNYIGFLRANYQAYIYTYILNLFCSKPKNAPSVFTFPLWVPDCLSGGI